MHYWQYQVEPMADLLMRARPVVERCGTQVQRATLLLRLSNLAVRRDFRVVDEVLEYARAALAASLATDDLSLQSTITFQLGLGHVNRNELVEAEEYLRAALECTERTGDVTLQSRCLNYLTTLYRKRGQVEQVRRYALESLAVSMSGEMLEYVAAARGNLAWAAWREGDLDEVEDKARSAVEMWRQMALAYPFQGDAVWPLIDALLTRNQIAEAIDYVRALLHPSQRPLSEVLRSAVEAAIQAWEEGRPESAYAHFQQATELARDQGYL
jgi:tetratricopeptide (TPR) repeat protein